MKDFKGSTNSEDRMFKAIQVANNSLPNGYIGTQTMSDIAVSVGAKCFPITLEIYKQPTIIGNDLIPFDPNGSIAKFKNSALGSYTHPRANTPCSILINKGKLICGNSCHAHINKPETVLFRLDNGAFGVKRATYSSELPKNIRWAVGGMGLLSMWNPEAEGFVGVYGDVHRRTSHMLLGVKKGMVYVTLCKKMTSYEVNQFAMKMQYEYAVMGDGGIDLSAINGEEKFAQININQTQGSCWQVI